MLQRIEFVHINSFLHRDIKPDNFLMGSGKNSHVLYIIDFGLAKRFIDPKTGEHIPFRDGKSLTGTARYASLNTHIGQEQSRRDDIESISFNMVYFLKGELPWQRVTGGDKDEKYKQIKEKKINTPITELSKGLPSQMLKFFEIVRNIGFEDAPDYILLRTLLAEMFTDKKYQNDFKYDWVMKAERLQKLDITNKVYILTVYYSIEASILKMSTRVLIMENRSRKVEINRILKIISSN